MNRYELRICRHCALEHVGVVRPHPVEIPCTGCGSREFATYDLLIDLHRRDVDEIGLTTTEDTQW